MEAIAQGTGEGAAPGGRAPGAGAGLDGLLASLEATLERIASRVEVMYRRYEELEELKEDLVPMAKGAVVAAADRLQRLEDEGALDFLREGARVAERVATSFTAADVRLLGENIVYILETVKNMTQPELLDLLNQATDLVQGEEAVEPVGALGFLRATRDPAVRRGLGILVELLRELGRESGSGAPGAPGTRAPGERRA